MPTTLYPILKDKAWLESQYCVEQKSADAIANDLGCSKYAVLHALRRHGIAIRKRSSKFPKLNDKEWVRKAYCEQKMSLKQIAKEAGCTFGTVATVLRTLGIERRGRKECLRVRYPERRKPEDHPNWKGGITPINHAIRTSTRMKEWRIACLKRDNYTCQDCGARGVRLEVDHIKQFAYHPELRFELSNGKTLCKPCHKKTPTHSRKLPRTSFPQAA